jgi:hypothetical protein
MGLHKRFITLLNSPPVSLGYEMAGFVNAINVKQASVGPRSPPHVCVLVCLLTYSTHMLHPARAFPGTCSVQALFYSTF